jgi:hypothetical protein
LLDQGVGGIQLPQLRRPREGREIADLCVVDCELFEVVVAGERLQVGDGGLPNIDEPERREVGERAEVGERGLGDREVREGCRGRQRREIRDARTKEIDVFQPLESCEPGDVWERVVPADTDGNERAHGTERVEVLDPPSP